jgi:hypothetical protein
MIALGTEIETALHRCITLRTAALEGLAQNQIKDDAETVGNQNGDHRPQHPVHTPARGVAVHVDDKEEIAGEYSSRKETKQTPDWGRWGVFLNCQQGSEEDLHPDKKQDSHSISPLRDQTQLLRELGSYFTLKLHMSSPFEYLSTQRSVRVGQMNSARQKNQAGGEGWRNPENHEAHLPNWA